MSTTPQLSNTCKGRLLKRLVEGVGGESLETPPPPKGTIRQDLDIPKPAKRDLTIQQALLERTHRTKMQEGQEYTHAAQQSHWIVQGLHAQDYEMDITYAAMTWINGVYRQQYLANLKSVQTNVGRNVCDKIDLIRYFQHCVR